MDTALAIALLVVLGFAAQWLAWRLKLPAILFLLLAGLLLGPATGVLDPDAVLGELLFPLVSLGVAIILFEGSLTLRFAEIRGLGPAILRLSTLGAAIAVLGLAAAAHLFAGLRWELALLFGAIGCVTGPTVIMPMLRSIRPNARIASVLRWEGIVVDPLGALLAVLVFEALALGRGGDVGLHAFAMTVLAGGAVGVAGALGLGTLLRRRWIPDYLQPVGTLALVLLAFAGANALAHESGLLAVTVMGMVLANMRGVDTHAILHFKEHLSTLVISLLFLVLAARVQAPGGWLLLQGAGVLLAAMLVVRPVSVLASTLFTSLSWRERALLAWVAPRGIVAASVSALFALKLEAAGVDGAQTLVALTFMLIVGTVVVQSATARPLARWLGVAEGPAQGVLLVGANPVSMAIADALRRQGFRPVIADEDWSGVRAARMAGLEAFHGNPVSAHADGALDLVGIGHLMALSTRADLNALACLRYRPEFGARHVFQLPALATGEAPRADVADALQAPALFAPGSTHAVLAAKLAAGWVIKSSRLGGPWDWNALVAAYAEPPLLLWGRDEEGRLLPLSSDGAPALRPGMQLAVLVDPASKREAAVAGA